MSPQPQEDKRREIGLGCFLFFSFLFRFFSSFFFFFSFLSKRKFSSLPSFSSSFFFSVSFSVSHPFLDLQLVFPQGNYCRKVESPLARSQILFFPWCGCLPVAQLGRTHGAIERIGILSYPASGVAGAYWCPCKDDKD